jgi:hypothetical protein
MSTPMLVGAWVAVGRTAGYLLLTGVLALVASLHSDPKRRKAARAVLYRLLRRGR